MSNLHVWYTDPWGKLLPWSCRDEREGEELAMFICPDDTKEARIPEGTKEFTSLPSLPELRILHLPSTLEVVTEKAICSLFHLEEVDIGDNPNFITQTGFLHCKTNGANLMIHGAPRIAIPSFVENPEELCFEHLYTEELDLSSEMKILHGNQIRFNSKLRNLILPDGLETVKSGAIKECNKLEHLHFPDKVRELMRCSIMGCDNLKSISIPLAMEKISPVFFHFCPKLCEIIISPDHPHYYMKNDMLIGKEGTLVASLMNIEEAIIPEGVAVIPKELFCRRMQLRKVITPSSLRCIEQQAFSEADNLEEIQLNEGLETIQGRAFSSEKLTSIRLPDSLREIRGDCFASCPALEQIEISDDHPMFKMENQMLLTKDGQKVVLALCSITHAIVPEGVKEIGEYAFFECLELQELILPDTIEKIGSHAFEFCKKLEKVAIPTGVNVAEDAFLYCKLLK